MKPQCTPECQPSNISSPSTSLIAHTYSPPFSAQSSKQYVFSAPKIASSQLSKDFRRMARTKFSLIYGRNWECGITLIPATSTLTTENTIELNLSLHCEIKRLNPSSRNVIYTPPTQW